MVAHRLVTQRIVSTDKTLIMIALAFIVSVTEGLKISSDSCGWICPTAFVLILGTERARD